MANPPTFANVQLLLPLDGADAATATDDASTNGLAITFHGNAQLDTAQSKFGGSSLLLDGTGDYIRAALTSTLMQFGTGDFTVEAWVRTSTVTRFIFDTGIYSGFVGRWAMSINASSRLTWWHTDSFGDFIDLPATSTSVATGDWVHVAACRSGSTLRLFVNGSVVGTFGSHTVNYSSAGTYLSIGSTASGSAALNGHMDDLRITAEAVYDVTFTPPTEALPIPSASANDAIASAPSPLGAPALLAYSDFTSQLDPAASTFYLMDLVTPGGLVRVPISSWQATLQTDVQSYVQCVVPAATDWVPDIEAATEFVITRRGMLLDGSTIEYEMARAPTQTISLDGGPFNYTATISGYTPAIAAVEDPPAAFDRPLSGVRLVSRNSGNVRVRCNIDWMLRPGQRAFLDEEAIVVRFVNYYCPGRDQYMDVGDRAA